MAPLIKNLITALLLFCMLGVSSASYSKILEENSPPKLTLTHVNIIDVLSGDIQKDMTIHIEGKHIVGVEENTQASKFIAERIVDGKGGFIIPGLWDMHAHVVTSGPEYAFPMFLKYGVLGIRDMGWGANLDPIILREKIASGEIIGPRMVVAGATLDGDSNNFPYRIRISTVDEVPKVLKNLKESGVDFIKVHAALPRDIYFAIAKEAKNRDLVFAGHVPRSVTAAEVSDAGQATIEHMSMELCEFTSLEDEVGTSITECKDQKILNLLDKFKENDTWLVPTLSVFKANYETYITNGSDFERVIDGTDPRHGEFPVNKKLLETWKSIIELTKKLTTPKGVRNDVTKKTWDIMKKMVKLASKRGVKIMSGTDFGYLGLYPGHSTHLELEAFVEAGLTPLETLQSATLNPIQYLGLEEEMGNISAGMEANFLLLEENPLEDITNTRKIKAVILNGKLILPNEF